MAETLVAQATGPQAPPAGRAACGAAAGCARSAPPAENAGGVYPGAPPSNTAPANCGASIEGTRIVRSGIDSLYLSYRGRLSTECQSTLETLKARAQSCDAWEQAQAVVEAVGHRFEVRDKGKGRFPFVLVDGHFHLQVSRREAASLPMVYAQLGSEMLTRTGVGPSVGELNAVVQSLGDVAELPRVSRVDLCVDFVTDCDLAAIPDDAWIRRAEGFDRHVGRDGLTGFSFGMGGNLAARLYDKTLQAKKEGIDYLPSLWQQLGWDGSDKVWRLEFQFERAVLREFGLRTVREVQDARPRLWEYGCAKWLRLAVPSEADKTRARWPTHHLWEILTVADWGKDRGEPLYRSRKTRSPSDEYLFVPGLGAVTSFMAREGIANIDEAWPAFIECARDYHRNRKRGKVLATYAREKAAAKARRYNTSPTKSKEVDRSAYRRAKERE